MEDDLRILPSTESVYQEILRIHREGFLAKFRFVSRDDEIVSCFADDFGLIDLKTPEKEFVAVSGGKVKGILSLRFSEQKKTGFEPNRTMKELRDRYGMIGMLKATVLGWLFDHKTRSDELYIDTIGVSSDARGEGIGTKLLGFSRALAREKGKHRLTLYVMKENTRAKALYERFGFHVVSYRPLRWFRRSSGYSGAYFMEMEP